MHIKYKSMYITDNIRERNHIVLRRINMENWMNPIKDKSIKMWQEHHYLHISTYAEDVFSDTNFLAIEKL